MLYALSSDVDALAYDTLQRKVYGRFSEPLPTDDEIVQLKCASRGGSLECVRIPSSESSDDEVRELILGKQNDDVPKRYTKCDDIVYVNDVCAGDNASRGKRDTRVDVRPSARRSKEHVDERITDVSVEDQIKQLTRIVSDVQKSVRREDVHANARHSEENIPADVRQQKASSRHRVGRSIEPRG